MNNLLKGLNIYLIGMMGVGKTTVGKLLAEQFNYRFLDTDSLIETLAKKKKYKKYCINDIFEEEGETNFRDLETQVLAQVSPYTRSVISTGGGIVVKRQNWSYLHYGLIIWLDAPVDLLAQRLAEDDTRPLLRKEKNIELKLQSLLEQRQPLYSQADLHILIENNKTPEDIVTEIITQIPHKIKPKFQLEL